MGGGGGGGAGQSKEKPGGAGALLTETVVPAPKDPSRPAFDESPLGSVGGDVTATRSAPLAPPPGGGGLGFLELVLSDEGALGAGLLLLSEGLLPSLLPPLSPPLSLPAGCELGVAASAAPASASTATATAPSRRGLNGRRAMIDTHLVCVHYASAPSLLRSQRRNPAVSRGPTAAAQALRFGP